MFSAEAFNGFDDAAFSAFQQKKRASNMYNMERMRVGELLNIVGDAAEKVLRQSDVTFARAVTPHTPSVFNGRQVAEMALYFTRTAEQKKAIAPVLDRKVALPDQISDAGEYHRHGFLGVLITEDRVDVGLMIHSRAWLDIMNLLNRCREKEEEAQRLVRLLHLMKAGAVVRLAPGREVPAAAFDAPMLNVIEGAVMNESFSFFVGYSFEPGDEVVRGRVFLDRTAEILGGMIDLWKFCMWKPTSNFLVSPKAADGQPQETVIDNGTVVNFHKGSTVRLSGGIFAGRTGVVQDMDAKGNVKVLVGRVTVRTESHLVRAV